MWSLGIIWSGNLIMVKVSLKNEHKNIIYPNINDDGLTYRECKEKAKRIIKKLNKQYPLEVCIRIQIGLYEFIWRDKMWDGIY